MSSIYYKIFCKYGAVISSRLYPDQQKALEKAFDKLEAGEVPERMPDCFSQFAFDMFLCDYYAGKEQGEK